MSEQTGDAPECCIVVVHGRDFKPAAEQFAELSLAALRTGIERDYPEHVEAFDGLSCQLAYYGDLTNALLEGRGRHYDPALDLGDRCNALAALAKVPARKRFGIRQYDCLPGKSALPEFVAHVATPFLGALGMTMPVLSRVSRDFHEYLVGKTSYAEQVRRRIRTSLCEQLDQGRRVMLIAHGTGAAASYDVLWQLSHDRRFREDYADCKVDTWVTLGAPLGNARIRKQLLGSREGAAAMFPTNVISWHNVSAEDDYTCHDNTLADDFKRMLKQRMVSAVHDYRIYNLAVRYGRSNPHSSIGYFVHPRMAKIIVDWIAASTMETVPSYTP